MTDPDDLLLGSVPDPDDEPTAAERAHAKSFGELVDATLLGRPLPPAMSADERALIEVATVIRAGSGGMHLAPSTQRSIVEDALKKAIGEPTRSAELPAQPMPSLADARAKRGLLPWIVSGVSTAIAAAAVVVLLVRTPTVTSVPTVPVAVTPIEETSRPTDALIGPIDKRDAGNAATRIDTIFADRLSGFRDRTLGGRR